MASPLPGLDVPVVNPLAGQMTQTWYTYFQSVQAALFGSGGLFGSLYKVRQVATRCYVPDIFTSANKQVMSRSRHRAQDDITSLQILIPNWYVDGVNTNPGGFTYAELGIGAAATITASIEYPVGTFTQIKFSGSTSGLIASGSSLLSDAVKVSIPEGAFFFVRIYFTSTAGVIFSYVTQDAARGEAVEFGASGITDKTMGGAVTQTSGTNMFMPCAIVARTTKKAVLLTGDSIMNGYYGDAVSSSYVNQGYVARSIGASFAYINCGVGGDRVELCLASHTQRLALKQYCDAMICGYGRNSLGVGRTASQVAADLVSFWSLYDIPVLQTTLPPDTTDVTGAPFTTLAGQTVQAWEAYRVTLNDYIRLEPIQIRDFIQIDTVLESSKDSGKWAVTPFPMTGDGVHPNYGGAYSVRNSGVVESRLLQVLR